MVTTAEDAGLLFGRWLEEETLLRVKLRSAALIFDAAGRMRSFDSNVMHLSGQAWQVVVPVAGATFTFSDPREVPVASVREAEASRYEFGMGLELPNGDKLALMEMKIPDAEPASDEAGGQDQD